MKPSKESLHAIEKGSRRNWFKDDKKVHVLQHMNNNISSVIREGTVLLVNKAIMG